MTSEVAVLNSVGVALAADSALTVGGSKVYASVDKLFQLHDREPVGVMVYGNATLATIPWETIIKEYRRTASGTAFNHISDYADDFTRFLVWSADMFPNDARERGLTYAVETFLHGVVRAIYADLEACAEQKTRGISGKDIKSIVRKNINLATASLRSQEQLNFSPPLELKEGKELARSIAATVVAPLFERLPLSKSARRLLDDLVYEKITRAHMGLNRSGVVFAGFGSKEFVPSLVSLEVEEFAGNRLRVWNRKKISMSENGAAVVPFAQKEMVDAFMKGIHPELSDFFAESTEEFFVGVIDALISNGISAPGAGAVSKESAIEAVKRQLGELRVAWERKSQDFWQPVLENVHALPKDEIASMAEALVNLTKFRRRVSLDRETVGGPIDVAVITRGDGFVWIKRKHYFQPELNPRALSRIAWGTKHD